MHMRESLPLSVPFYWAQIFLIDTRLSWTWSKNVFVIWKSFVKSQGKPAIPSNSEVLWLKNKRRQFAGETKPFPARCLFIVFGILYSSFVGRVKGDLLPSLREHVLIYFQSLLSTFAPVLKGSSEVPVPLDTQHGTWPNRTTTQLARRNQSIPVLIAWKHRLICSQLEIKVDGLDLVSGDTHHQVLVGNSALQKMKVGTARWSVLACHLMGMSVFSHESLLAPLLGAANLRRKPGPHFMLNNLPGFSFSV